MTDIKCQGRRINPFSKILIPACLPPGFLCNNCRVCLAVPCMRVEVLCNYFGLITLCLYAGLVIIVKKIIIAVEAQLYLWVLHCTVLSNEEIIIKQKQRAHPERHKQLHLVFLSNLILIRNRVLILNPSMKIK